MTRRPAAPRRATSALRLRHAWLLTALAAAGAMQPGAVRAAEPAPQAAAAKAYQLPAGPLGESLARFAAAAGVTVQVDASLVQGLSAPALSGRHSVAGGFAILLDGSGLQALERSAGVWVLRAAAARPAAAASAAGAGVVQPRPEDLVLPVVTVRAQADRESATGPVLGYAAGRSATATKSDTSILETPQAIAVVSREQIVDTGALTLDQALNYAAGVRSDIWGVNVRLDSPQIRGVESSIFLDGLNNQVDYWTGSIPIEPYLLERVEVLRGPSSMLYGQSVSSGLVNGVSKQPQAGPAREVGLVLGSFERRQLQADLTGPLTDHGQWLYRLVVLARDSATQVDFSRADRQLVAPSLTWRPDADTQWTLRGRWQKDRASGDSGSSLPWEGTILPNPNGAIARHTFLGEPNADRFDADNAQLGWTFSRRIAEHWEFRQNLRWTDNQVDYASIYAYSPYLDEAQRLLDRYGYYWKRNTRVLAADQLVEGEIDTGAVKHRLLFGFDLLRHRSAGEDAYDSPIDQGGTLAPIDAFAPRYDPAYAIPAYSRNPTSGVRQAGFYAQDQMRAGPWIAVLGLRHDRSTNWEEGAADRDDRANTSRAALMYELASGLMPYLSYSESFQPQANTASGQRLDPLRGQQWELGAKFEPTHHRWRASGAVYVLREKKRVVQVSPIEVNQTGQTRNSGVELEWVGRVASGLDISANYTYTKVDEQLMASPKHRAAFWGTYRFALGGLSGFSAGLGVRYAGSFTDGEGTPTTPAATVVDAMLAWESAPVRLALNVSNLADKTYLSNCWSWGECGYAAARSVTLTASYRF